MENTASSEINIPIPPIIVVIEANEQCDQEDTENKNQATESSNQVDFQVQDDNQSSKEQKIEYCNGLYAFVLLGVCVSVTSTVTMIPEHNVFEYPEFWWERLVLRDVFFSLSVALFTTQENFLIFNGEGFNSKLYPFTYFIAIYLGYAIPYLCIYILWTMYMVYNFPMPYVTVPGALFHRIPLFVAVWFGFRREFRCEPNFIKRFMSFVVYKILTVSITYQEAVTDKILVQLTIFENENGIQVQWLLAIIIPTFRGFFEWILPKVFSTAAGNENEAAWFFMESSLACRYAVYVTVRLVSVDASTVYWMLGVELCINLYYALRIILMHNKVGGDMTAEEITKWKNKKQVLLRNLVTIEAIEILIPLAYSMSYATAYYGPNATIMKGVKNNYFGNAEQDIQDLFKSVFKMAVLDACGATFIGLLLKLQCQINIVDEFCVIMKKYWITLSIIMGYNMYLVRNVIYSIKKR